MAKLLDETALGNRPTPEAATGLARYRGEIPDREAVGNAMGREGEAIVSVGAGVVRQGEQLASEANKLFAEYKAEQAKVDTLRAEDAYTQLRNAQLEMTYGENGFVRKKGEAAVVGMNVQESSATFEAAAQRIAGGLTNDTQRKLFQSRASVAGLQFKEDFVRHQFQERNKWATDVTENGVASEINQIAGIFSRPGFDPQLAENTVLASVTRMRSLIQAHSDDLGLSPAGVDRAMQKASDQALVKKYQAWSSWDPVGADADFRKDKTAITDPAIRLQMQNTLRESAVGVSAGIEAQRVVDEVRSRTPPAGVSRGVPVTLRDAVIMQESGGNNTVISPKKAMGTMQVIESTAKSMATKLGVPYDRALLTANTPEGKAYNIRLGTAYLEEQLDTFGGNQTLALAAYNAGPAVVTDWINGTNASKKNPGLLKLGDPNTGAISDADFAARIPFQETRNYVASINAKSPPGSMLRVSGAGADANPTTQNTNNLPNSRDIAAELPRMMLRVEERATALYGADPGNPDRAAFVKRLTAEIHSRVSADVYQLNAIQRQAQGIIIDAVMGQSAPRAGGLTPVGGAQRPGAPGMLITSFSQIAADPKLMEAWRMMDPAAKQAMELRIDRNMLANDRGDTVLFRDLFSRIHQEPGTPGKIDFYQQIIAPENVARLSNPQIQQLRLEIDRAETPGGRSANQMRKAADAQVVNWFRTNLNSNLLLAGTKATNPGAYIDWTMRWNETAGNKVDEYVKAGKDVRTLFMVDTPDSIVKPAYLQTFLSATPTPQALGDRAAQVRDGQTPALAAAPQPVAQPATIDTREKLDAWFATLPPAATTFVGTDGRVRLIPGRPSQPAPGPAAATSADAAPAAVMNDQGKIVPPPAPVVPAAEVEISVDDIKIYQPKTVAQGIADTRVKREDAQERERQRAAIDGRIGIMEGLKKIGAGAVDAMPAKQMITAAGDVGRGLAQVPAVEADRVKAGWADIKKTRVVSPADVDLIEKALEYGLPPKDEKLAKALLKKLEGGK